MKRLQLLVFLLAIAPTEALAQSPASFLKEVRKIKVLESTRLDVQQILYEYKLSDDDGHDQEFSNGVVDIAIDYATGNCSDDPEDDDYSATWSVPEWTVVRIEINPSEPIKPEDAGLDLSKFVKEQKYRDDPDLHVYHDKTVGLAIEVDEDGIETITFFPPRAVAKKKLCDDNKTFKEFYASKSWFREKLEDRTGEIYCAPPASVTDLVLSATEISPTGERKIEVTATARNPENDVLTYKYFVNAGTIRGTGPKVIWDLAPVPPGTYTLTAGVDDGCGLCGATFTKTVIVK